MSRFLRWSGSPPGRSIFKEGIEKPEILAILAEITDFLAC
jgi:hypothetical protein